MKRPGIATFTEIFKFGIYIMFPIGTLYAFGNPDFLAKFPNASSYHAQQPKLFENLPKTKQQIDKAVILVYKGRKLEGLNYLCYLDRSLTCCLDGK